MEKQDNNKYDKSYHPPETISWEYCGAILAVVIKHHPKAYDMFNDIKEAISVPGVQDTFLSIEKKIPDTKTITKNIVTKAGYTQKSKPEDNPAITARRIIKGSTVYMGKLTNRFMRSLLFNRKRKRDLQTLALSIDSFIRACFNNEFEKTRGHFKVTSSTTKTLVNLVFICALLETNEKFDRMFKRMGKIPAFKHGKKRFDVNTVLDGNIPALMERNLIKQYMDAGFKLKHTKVIETGAWRWYQCRVVHDGPTSYYSQQLKHPAPEDPVIVEPENLLHELEPFDEALGYVREKTGKKKQ